MRGLLPIPITISLVCAALAAPALAQQDGFRTEGESPLPEITQAEDVPPFIVDGRLLEGEDAAVLEWEPQPGATRYEVYLATGPFPAEAEADWEHLTDPEAQRDDVRLQEEGDVVSFRHQGPPLPEGGASAIEYAVVAYGEGDEIVAQGRGQVAPSGQAEGPVDAPPVSEEGPFGDGADRNEQAEEAGAETTGSALLMVLVLIAVALIGAIAYVLIQIGRR